MAALKDPNAPKQPKSSYQYFVEERRALFKNANPTPKVPGALAVLATRALTFRHHVMRGSVHPRWTSVGVSRSSVIHGGGWARRPRRCT